MREMLKIYWNPIVLSIATMFMYLLVIRQLQDYLSVSDFFVELIGFAYPIIVVGLFIWFFMHFFVSWPVAIIQMVYGIVKFRATSSKSYLHNCFSSLLVLLIYGIVIILGNYGFILDA